MHKTDCTPYMQQIRAQAWWQRVEQRRKAAQDLQERVTTALGQYRTPPVVDPRQAALQKALGR